MTCGMWIFAKKAFGIQDWWAKYESVTQLPFVKVPGTTFG